LKAFWKRSWKRGRVSYYWAETLRQVNGILRAPEENCSEEILEILGNLKAVRE
jgi:hypothetical protein